MGSDNTNLIVKKCGEILINLNKSNKTSKTYTFHCSFCESTWDQIEKFSLHLEDFHMKNFDVESNENAMVCEGEISTELRIEGESKEIDNGILPDDFEPACEDNTHIKQEKLSDCEFLNIKTEEVWYDDVCDNSNFRDSDGFNFRSNMADPSSKIYTENRNNTTQNTVTSYTELFEQQPNLNLNANSQTIAYTDHSITSNNGNSNQITEILSLVRKIDQNIKLLNAKTDSLTVEMKSIRSEIPSIKTTAHGDIVLVQYFIPQEPFVSMEQYDKFDSSLEDEQIFQQFVKELSMSKEKSYEKFIRNLWKKFFCDELAQQFSWRGTANKKGIRGARLTLAMRQAFKMKFPLEDDDFDKISQKFFQYAHDRLCKSARYQEKRMKVIDDETSPP